MPEQATVLFAGGGTGGHIFPNLAVLERLRDRGATCAAHLVLSQRPLDAELARRHDLPYTALPVQPLTGRPWRWPGWYRAWRRSVQQARRLLREQQVRAVVVTGGFVSGPVVVAAQREGVAAALVNLDAVPGKANRAMARRATKLFTAFTVPDWCDAELIGVPLRRAAIGETDKASARAALGLDPARPLMLVCGGSQGAQTLNRLMPALLADAELGRALATWQVLHLTGQREAGDLEASYASAQVTARVVPFCDAMGQAWRGAAVALSRAGASSVAEAWANACPTIFFPYPYHRDEHQRLNAQPMVATGAAWLLRDRIDPQANAGALKPVLLPLLQDADRLEKAALALRESNPPDGAAVVADWLDEQIKR